MMLKNHWTLALILCVIQFLQLKRGPVTILMRNNNNSYNSHIYAMSFSLRSMTLSDGFVVSPFT